MMTTQRPAYFSPTPRHNQPGWNALASSSKRCSASATAPANPVSESIASGLLVPFQGDVQVDGAGYSALCVPGRERHPPVRAFFAWLQEEALLSGLAPRSQPSAAHTGQAMQIS